MGFVTIMKKVKSAKSLVFKPEFRSRVVRDRTDYVRNQKHKDKRYNEEQSDESK
jgi:hypothetical protein